MSQMEKIQHELNLLPPEKQGAVLEFIEALRMALPGDPVPTARRCLREHPAFGSWQDQNIDALGHQHSMRAEWDA